jgi:hypothetical protein
MHAALKVIGAFSETRHVPAGESISGISEQGSEGIDIQNGFGNICLLLMRTVFANRSLQTRQTILIQKRGSQILIMALLKNDFTLSIQTGE